MIIDVYVGDDLIAKVPLWMVVHAIEDAINRYSADIIRLEAKLDF